MFGINIPECFYIKDPAGTDLGRRIVSSASDQIKEFGFNSFTLKKLANEIKSVEASVYRYFESKEHLAYYLLANYWAVLEFRLAVFTSGIDDPKLKLEKTIDVLVGVLNEEIPGLQSEVEFKILQQIARDNYFYSLSLLHDNSRHNDIKKSFKQQVSKIQSQLSELIGELSPNFRNANALADTIINQSLYSTQELNMAGLPTCTEGYEKIAAYLKELVGMLR
ncbi:TetR family transcriptional regulator [bacterium]|nr:TetR family transcriptional regulator [bacterium]